MHTAILRTLAALTLSVVLGACSSTPTANTDFDEKYDFSDVKSIYIQPFDRSAADTVKVSDLQVARVTDALSSELKRKGFGIADAQADADMLMTWHLVTEERADVRTYNSASYYSCWRCAGPIGPAVTDVSVHHYTMGTLIVDMIDPESLRSVWRSVIESRMRSQPDPEKAAENRAAAAQSIFSQFPPGAAP